MRHRTSNALTATLVLCGVALTVALNLTPIYTSDFWLQLHVGGMIRDSGAVPETILFSFTEAKDFPFHAHEWLPSVVTSALFDAVSYRGMIVFKCLIAVMIFALSLSLAWRINRNLPAAVLIAAVVIVAINFRTHMRPEIFALVFVLVDLHLLLSFLRTSRRIWLAAMLPVGLVWANTHGSFLVNIGLPLLFLAGSIADDLRDGELAAAETRWARIHGVYAPLGLCAAGIFAVSLINPYGFGLFRFAYEFSQAAFVRQNIVEFGATYDSRIWGFFYFKLYLVLVASMLLSFLRSRGSTRWLTVVLFVAFGFLSVGAIRYSAWLAVVGSWVLAHNLATLGLKQRAFPAILAAVLLAGTAVVATEGNVRGKPIGFENMSPLNPQAIAYLRESGVRGNVFNSYNYGDQLVYEFYPDLRVTIDSRVDAYGEEYYMRYRSMSGRSLKLLGTAKALADFLNAYDVRTIVTRPYDYRNWQLRGIATALAAEGWRATYSDEKTIVMRRH